MPALQVLTLVALFQCQLLMHMHGMCRCRHASRYMSVPGEEAYMLRCAPRNFPRAPEKLRRPGESLFSISLDFSIRVQTLLSLCLECLGQYGLDIPAQLWATDAAAGDALVVVSMTAWDPLKGPSYPGLCLRPLTPPKPCLFHRTTRRFKDSTLVSVK